MSIKLPTRYEDLAPEFKGKLRPSRPLLDLIKSCYQDIQITGGIRFLPIFGESGSGKSCAARELSTHLPDCTVVDLPREAIESRSVLNDFVDKQTLLLSEDRFFIAVVDQYEESVAASEEIPTRFVESLSLLDRDNVRSHRPMLFIWLTTSRDFQGSLEKATSRNKRILAQSNFELLGPAKEDWSGIIEETFEFHNSGKSLADYFVLQSDIEIAAKKNTALGSAMLDVARSLSGHVKELNDISDTQIVILWPVTDGQRIAKITSFTNAREGYKLDWNALYRELNQDERRQLPLDAYNRARLYFDVRLIPIAAADLQPLCRNLDLDELELASSHLERFKGTHFYYVISGMWGNISYKGLVERESKRAENARNWYETVTNQPVKLGKRLACILRKTGHQAEYEVTQKNQNSTIRTDVKIKRPSGNPSEIIVELKAYNPENTIPSNIKQAILTTLRRHAQFAGFIDKR